MDLKNINNFLDKSFPAPQNKEEQKENKDNL